MKNKSKKNIQKQLEKLSWQFAVETEKLKKELEEMKDDFLEETEEDDYVDKTQINPDDSDKDGGREDYNKEIESWYGAGDYGVNDMGRNAGIVFDEEKLEATRVRDWHKPEKIRRSWLDKLTAAVLSVLSWPFKAVAFIVTNFIRGVFGLVRGLIVLVYKILRGVVVTAWQVVVAFKYAWVYLFGDFDWLKKEELAMARASVRAEPLARKSKLADWSVWKRVVVFIILAFILVLPLQIYLSYNKVKDIKGQVLGASESGVSHLKEAGLAGSNFDFATAGEQFGLAEQDFGLAEQSVEKLGFIAEGMAKLLPDLEAGQDLLKVAKLSAQMGKLKENLETSSMDVEGTGESQAAVSEKVDWVRMSDELNMALTKTYEAKDILEKIDLEKTELAAYESELEGLKGQMPELIGWLESSRDVFEILLYLMGTDEPRRWMLVFQNNSELRPTGGFMGSYAILDIKDGEIKNIDVPGGGFYDLKGSLAVQVEAPYPFHLFSPIWQPWNANWFADWPASAEKIMWFYDKSGGPTVDGVIAFTPDVLEKLLALTGEIDMPEYETKVDSQNFVKMAQTEVELEYDREENQPKKFIADLLPKVLEKTMELGDEKILDVWQVISDSLKEKQLLIYLDNQELENKVEAFGWAGRVLNQPSDYLMVVHTNVAGGKTDRVIKTKIEHQVEILENGSLIDRVSLTKEHQGQSEDIFEGQTNIDYVRFYVPQGSELLDAEGFDAMPTDRQFQMATADVASDADLERIEKNLQIDPDSGMRITDEFGKTVFANWMQVAPGETKTVKVKYLLPFRFDPTTGPGEAEDNYNLWDLIKQYFFGNEKRQLESGDDYVYSLVAQKQAGTNDDELISRFKIDGSWVIKDYLPREDVVVTDTGVAYSDTLKTDKFYGVVINNP
jgi:hypothetical protein